MIPYYFLKPTSDDHRLPCLSERPPFLESAATITLSPSVKISLDQCVNIVAASAFERNGKVEEQELKMGCESKFSQLKEYIVSQSKGSRNELDEIKKEIGFCEIACISELKKVKSSEQVEIIRGFLYRIYQFKIECDNRTREIRKDYYL